MFTSKDLAEIDRSYFRIQSAGCISVSLQSKNTKHCWYILSEEYNGRKTCKIFHSHHKGTSYHLQTSARNLNAAQEKIKAHDEYHLNIRLKKKAKRQEARECRIRSRLNHSRIE